MTKIKVRLYKNPSLDYRIAPLIMEVQVLIVKATIKYCFSKVKVAYVCWSLHWHLKINKIFLVWWYLVCVWVWLWGFDIVDCSGWLLCFFFSCSYLLLLFGFVFVHISSLICFGLVSLSLVWLSFFWFWLVATSTVCGILCYGVSFGYLVNQDSVHNLFE